jgi:CubicO group peptidase (beta-lactamase class C family)
MRVNKPWDWPWCDLEVSVKTRLLQWITCAFFLIFCVRILSQPAWAEACSPSGATDRDIEARIERIVEGLRRPSQDGLNRDRVRLLDRMRELRVPGVSIAVIHCGAIEWARGFGIASVGGPAIGVNTLFQAASISKPVTAVAALALVQSGILNLDSDVNSFMKSWKVPSNVWTRTSAVSLRRLLSHSGGVTVGGFEGYELGVPVPTLVLVLDGEAPANNAPITVDSEPGAQYRYSSGGYTIVQQLLIDVTGKKFPELMNDLVLRPFGMLHSAFQQPLPPIDLDAAATPYLKNGQQAPGGPHTYPELAAAGLWTTPTDVARFAIAVLDAWSGGQSRVLTHEMASQMLTPGLGDYGLGLIVKGSKPYRRFSHGGVNRGFISLLMAYETGDGAVIMTNSDRGQELIDEVMRSLATEYEWKD